MTSTTWLDCSTPGCMSEGQHRLYRTFDGLVSDNGSYISGDDDLGYYCRVCAALLIEVPASSLGYPGAVLDTLSPEARRYLPRRADP